VRETLKVTSSVVSSSAHAIGKPTATPTVTTDVTPTSTSVAGASASLTTATAARPTAAILRTVRTRHGHCPAACSTKLRVALWPQALGSDSRSSGASRIANVDQLSSLVAEYTREPLAVLSAQVRAHDEAGLLGLARSLGSFDVLISPHGPHLLAAPLFSQTRSVYLELRLATTARADDAPCRLGRPWTGGWLIIGGHLPLRRQQQPQQAGWHRRSFLSAVSAWALSRAATARMEVDWALANRQSQHCPAGAACAARMRTSQPAGVLVDAKGLRAALELAISMRCDCGGGGPNSSHYCHQLSVRRRGSRRVVSARDLDVTPRSFLCCNATCSCRGCHEACTGSWFSCPMGRRELGAPPRRPWDTHQGSGGCDQR